MKNRLLLICLAHTVCMRVCKSNMSIASIYGNLMSLTCTVSLLLCPWNFWWLLFLYIKKTASVEEECATHPHYFKLLALIHESWSFVAVAMSSLDATCYNRISVFFFFTNWLNDHRCTTLPLIFLFTYIIETNRHGLFAENRWILMMMMIG